MANSIQPLSVPFLPTTQSFPEDPGQLRNTLSKRDTDIAQTINTKTNGAYNTVALNTGNKYYSLQVADNDTPQKQRPSMRQVFTFGAIAAPGTLTITHGITQIVELVAFYGNCITTPGAIPNAKYEPIPFVSTVNINQQVSLYMNDTIITIINGAGNNNILSGTIIVEFLLN